MLPIVLQLFYISINLRFVMVVAEHMASLPESS